MAQKGGGQEGRQEGSRAERPSLETGDVLLESNSAALRVTAGGDQVDGLPPDCSTSSDPSLLCPPLGFNTSITFGFCGEVQNWFRA